MGQKSNPIGLRLQINRTWDSRWFAEGHDYGRLLLEDLKIAIFTLVPDAAKRAKDILVERYPSLDIRINSDKVATTQLEQLAQNSDLVVL